MRALFDFRAPLGQRDYIFYGLLFFAIKYGIEALVLYISNGHLLTPFEFITPFIRERERVYGPAGFSKLPLYVSYALSLFSIWVAISLSARRALDAALSPWLVLFLFVPYVNLLFLVFLMFPPSRPLSVNPREEKTAREDTRFLAIIPLASVAFFGTLAVLVNVFVVNSYGTVLFAATPFVFGVALGYWVNRRELQSMSKTLSLMSITLLIWAGCLLVYAIEGVFCILMAVPLVAVTGLAGAALGSVLADRVYSPPLASLFVFLPVLGLLSSLEQAITPKIQSEVRSSIVVNAPIADVWIQVVTFSEIPEPTELLYKSGIAYPIRARIEGVGVGAVRYCEFNTGPFVEPITVWEEPTRLGFDVTSQPKPMTEKGIWGEIDAPHLDGYFDSQRGEFRLSSIDSSHTLLEGSTWYSLEIFPSAYWKFYAEYIVHEIHMRVLEHVKRSAETEIL